MDQQANKIRFSIIVAAYNIGEYIQRAVESVEEQTFKNYELIIVNDCSTDSSRDIMQSYADIDSRIRIVDNSSKRLNVIQNICYDSGTGRHYWSE